MSTPIWFITLIKKVFPDRFFLSRMTKMPFIGSIVNYLLFNGDDIVYLPGDHLILVNQSLADQVEDTVLPSRVVEYFINNAKYLWVMDFCICRESDNCQDYPKDLGCLFLGAVVLKISQNWKIGIKK